MKSPGAAGSWVRALYVSLLTAWSGTTFTLFAVAPPVTITSPTNGSVLSTPGSITIRASVSGGGNSVSKVEFFAGANSLGIDTSNPYRIDVENLPAGNHSLSAVLTDNAGDTSTNSINVFVNELPVVAIVNPLDGMGLIAPASFQVEATALDQDGTVVSVQFFRDKTAIGIRQTAPYIIPLNKLGVGSYTFDAVATDNMGGTRRATIDVVVKQRPTVAITAPAAGARLTEVNTLLAGTADDSRTLAVVEYSVNGRAFTPATGTKNWEAPLLLPAGTNVLRARATDVYGNHSLTNSRTVFQVVTSALSLTIQGNGTVSGATDGQILEVGRGYRLVASPGPGYLFSNWTGHASGTASTLNFLMETGMVLQANFVPNPFIRVSGQYNGLFFETESTVRHESSGDFQLRVSSSGQYRARLRLAGERVAASGVLDLQGRATNVIVRPGRTDLTLVWAVDLHGLDQVTGSVSDGAWTAELHGDRALFNASTNPAALAGRYTFVLPSGFDPGAPIADGWGSLRITTAGAVTATGWLPDGTKFSRKAPVSKNGAWPLYAPLYESKGCLVGWVQFDTNAALTDAVGPVAWLKPVHPGGSHYPDGFTNVSMLAASRYVAPSPGQQVLALTSGVLTLSGGGLSQNWVNEFVLGENGQVINASTNEFSIAISPSTGLFKGSFFDTGLNQAVNFSGALLQKSTNGAGYFIGPGQPGRVLLENGP